MLHHLVIECNDILRRGARSSESDSKVWMKYLSHFKLTRWQLIYKSTMKWRHNIFNIASDRQTSCQTDVECDQYIASNNCNGRRVNGWSQSLKCTLVVAVRMLWRFQIYQVWKPCLFQGYYILWFMRFKLYPKFRQSNWTKDQNSLFVKLIPVLKEVQPIGSFKGLNFKPQFFSTFKSTFFTHVGDSVPPPRLPQRGSAASR